MINENIGLFELAASNPGFVNALQRVSTLTRRSPASLLASAIGVSAAVALLQPRPDEPAPPLTGIRRGVGSNGGNDPNGSNDPKGPDNDPKPPIVPIIPPLGDEGIQKPALDLPANPVLPPPGQERQTGTNANGDVIFIDSFGNTYIRDARGNKIPTDLTGNILNRAQIDAILALPKGSRPDPSTYLSAQQIEAHLSHFQGGVVKIKANAPNGTEGPRGGTFVLSRTDADRFIRQAGGDVGELEKLLGIPSGGLGSNPVRVDIPNPTNLRVPSGNELGANAQFVPGGFTSGGVKEAVIDPVPEGSYSVTPILPRRK